MSTATRLLYEQRDGKFWQTHYGRTVGKIAEMAKYVKYFGGEKIPSTFIGDWKCFMDILGKNKKCDLWH